MEHDGGHVSGREIQTNRDRCAWCSRCSVGCASGLHEWHAQHLSVQADERPGSAYPIDCDVQHPDEAHQKALMDHCGGSRRAQLPLALPAAVPTLFVMMPLVMHQIQAGGANLDWKALLTTSRRQRSELRMRYQSTMNEGQGWSHRGLRGLRSSTNETVGRGAPGPRQPPGSFLSADNPTRTVHHKKAPPNELHHAPDSSPLFRMP